MSCIGPISAFATPAEPPTVGIRTLLRSPSALPFSDFHTNHMSAFGNPSTAGVLTPNAFLPPVTLNTINQLITLISPRFSGGISQVFQHSCYAHLETRLVGTLLRLLMRGFRHYFRPGSDSCASHPRLPVLPAIHNLIRTLTNSVIYTWPSPSHYFPTGSLCLTAGLRSSACPVPAEHRPEPPSDRPPQACPDRACTTPPPSGTGSRPRSPQA